VPGPLGKKALKIMKMGQRSDVAGLNQALLFVMKPHKQGDFLLFGRMRDQIEHFISGGRWRECLKKSQGLGRLGHAVMRIDPYSLFL